MVERIVVKIDIFVNVIRVFASMVAEEISKAPVTFERILDACATFAAVPSSLLASPSTGPKPGTRSAADNVVVSDSKRAKLDGGASSLFKATFVDVFPFPVFQERFCFLNSELQRWPHTFLQQFLFISSMSILYKTAGWKWAECDVLLMWGFAL